MWDTGNQIIELKQNNKYYLLLRDVARCNKLKHKVEFQGIFEHYGLLNANSTLPDRNKCLTFVVYSFSKLFLNTSDFSFKPPRQPVHLCVYLYIEMNRFIYICINTITKIQAG